MLRAHLFGGLALAWNDGPLPTIPGTASRSLFAYLITYRDRPHTRDLLAGTFWPDLPDATARRRLSNALWEIRRALRQAQDETRASHRVLLIDSDTVQLNPALPLWLDVEEFTKHKAQCTTSRPDALTHCELCLAHYRGEFLAGYYDDWAVLERERLQGMLLVALERLVEGYKGRGEYEQALSFARRLVAEEPWREEAHREAMRLCHLLGEHAEALKQFEACRQSLFEELGVEPSPETVALADEIATRSGLSRPPLLPAMARPVTAPLLERPDRLPLVGRRKELAELLRQVEAAVRGSGGLTLVYGEAGVGKSRLVRELAENARWRGALTAWGRCYELAAPPAYQPLVEALRASLPALDGMALEPLWRAELSRILPELATGEGTPPPLSPEEEQRRLLEAIARGFLAVAAARPVLVLLEDAQWMDPSSLEALHYLLPRLGEAPLLVVATVRAEELVGQGKEVLSAMESTRLPRRLDLGRLSAAETEELVGRVLELERPAPRFSARLYAETEGNAFFLLEMLWTLVEEGSLYRSEAGRWSTPWDESTEDYAELPLPRGVVHSITRRLERLPDGLNELLNMAAVIGRGISFELWRMVSGWTEEGLLTAGDALCGRGLLLAADPAAPGSADYAFAHDQIRRVAYERLAAPRCRFYHRRVAEALMELAPTNGQRLEALAYHWTGAEEWDKAAEYHHQAGDRARSVYANAEAVAHYTQALVALERAPGPADPSLKYRLHLAREAVYDLLGGREAQAEDLRVLEELAEVLDDDRRRAEVALRQAAHAYATGDYEGAVRAAEVVVRLSQQGRGSSHEARGRLEWGHALMNQGNFEEARIQLEEAVTLARAQGFMQAEAEGLRHLGSVFWCLGDYASAGTHYEQSLRICHQSGDRRNEGSALNNLGLVHLRQSDNSQATAYFQQALDIRRQIGDRWGEGTALCNLAIVQMDLGQLVQARTYCEQAMAIAREVGDRSRQALVLSHLASISRDEGDYGHARACYEQALDGFRAIGDERLAGAILNQLGVVALCQHAYSEAQVYHEQALSICRAMGDRQSESARVLDQGVVFHQLGGYPAARACYEQALQISRETGDRQVEGNALSYLGLLCHHVGDDVAACEHCQIGVSTLREIGYRQGLGYALVSLGHAFVGTGRMEEAAAVYQQALELRQDLGQLHLTPESMAGLARAFLMQGDLALAQRQVDEIMPFLETGTLEGTEEPLQIYLTCYRVLSANRDPRAESVLRAAHGLLVTWAGSIPDKELRRSFLENVVAHREIVAAHQALEASRQEGQPSPASVRGECRIPITLPRASAPLGRPLREHEFVTVTWTVEAPEDGRVRGKVARRRHRILRLLREAEAQGAAPRDEDLAGVLDVSLSTLRRDMTALRAEGHHLPTRWRKMTT